MKQQKNVLQTKEQGKNLQDQTNEDKIGNLPEKEFRVMIVKMIPYLGNRMEKIQEKSSLPSSIYSMIPLFIKTKNVRICKNRILIYTHKK